MLDAAVDEDVLLDDLAVPHLVKLRPGALERLDATAGRAPENHLAATATDDLPVAVAFRFVDAVPGRR